MSNINLNEKITIVCEPQSVIDKMQRKIECDPLKVINKLHRRADALQAKIDSLMLEYCPDEMTEEQLTNWASCQRVSTLIKE